MGLIVFRQEEILITLYISDVNEKDEREAEKWQEKLQYEYDYLLTENLFPDSVLQKFEVAIKEFQELSLSEIREIKKIVTENN